MDLEQIIKVFEELPNQIQSIIKDKDKDNIDVLLWEHYSNELDCWLVWCGDRFNLSRKDGVLGDIFLQRIKSAYQNLKALQEEIRTHFSISLELYHDIYEYYDSTL